MPDLLGYWAKIGVVVPSTNTTMEPEMHSMAPPGVTFHTARLYLAQSSLRTPEEAQKAAAAFQDALEIAVCDVVCVWGTSLPQTYEKVCGALSEV